MNVSKKLSKLSLPREIGFDRLLKAAADRPKGTLDIVAFRLELANRLRPVANIEFL